MKPEKLLSDQKGVLQKNLSIGRAGPWEKSKDRDAGRTG